jgi:hypothetical protein
MNINKLLPLAVLAGVLAAPTVAGAQSQAQATPGQPWPTVPIRFGGYFWLDTGFMQRTNTQESRPDQDTPYMQGRFGLLAGYEKTLGDWKLDAQVEILGLENEYAGSRYEAHILNSYVQIGQKTWDVQVGRFLNSEVYYRGQGIELYTPDEFGAENGPAIYHLDTIRGHQDQPGQLAFHYMPVENVKIELAGVYGFATTQQVFGFRPMIDVGYAGLRLFAGYEYLNRPTNQPEGFKVKDNSKGYAARLQYALPFVTVGANYSSKTAEFYGNDEVLNTGGSGDTTSVGGFADFYFGEKRHSVGLGYHHTEFTNERELADTQTQDQMFATALYRLPFDGFSVKGVVGFARAELEDRSLSTPATYQNDLLSFRIRLAYDFL